MLPGHKKASLSSHCDGVKDMSHNFQSQQMITRPRPKHKVSGDPMGNRDFHLHLEVTRGPSPLERCQRRPRGESGFLQPASQNEADLCPLLPRKSVKATWGGITRHSSCYQPRKYQQSSNGELKITPPFYSDKKTPSSLHVSIDVEWGTWTSNPAWK